MALEGGVLTFDLSHGHVVAFVHQQVRSHPKWWRNDSGAYDPAASVRCARMRQVAPNMGAGGSHPQAMTDPERRETEREEEVAEGQEQRQEEKRETRGMRSADLAVRTTKERRKKRENKRKRLRQDKKLSKKS